MELEIQQCEKTKAVREEQLERLTQICQEQAVSPRPEKTLRGSFLTLVHKSIGQYAHVISETVFEVDSALHSAIF